MQEHYTRLQPATAGPLQAEHLKSPSVPTASNQGVEPGRNEPEAVSEVETSDHARSDEAEDKLAPTTCAPPPSRVVAESDHRDWQREFEELALCHVKADIISDGLGLATLIHEFTIQAQESLKKIVYEVTLDEDARSIPSVSMVDDTFLSGDERVRRCVMKFAADGQILYVTNDEVVRAVFGQQLRSARAFHHTSLRLPLQCVVDYVGFRAYVRCPTTGRFVMDELESAIAMLGIHIHEPRVVQPTTLENMYRIFSSTEAPADYDKLTTTRFRPEFVATIGAKLPLMPGIVSSDSTAVDSFEAAQRTALVVLLRVVIPAFVNEIETRVATEVIDSATLTEAMHHEGINACHLGRCLESATTKHTKRLFLSEMIGRTCKRLLRVSLQAMLKDAATDVKRVARIVSGQVEEQDDDEWGEDPVDDELDQAYLPTMTEVSKEVLHKITTDVVTEVLSLTVGISSGDSRLYWDDVILPQLRTHFVVSNPGDHPLASLDTLIHDELIHWPQVLSAIVYHAGLQVDQGTTCKLGSINPFLDNAAHVEIFPRIKTLCQTTATFEHFISEADGLLNQGHAHAALDRVKAHIVLLHVMDTASTRSVLGHLSMCASEICLHLSYTEEAERYTALALQKTQGAQHARALLCQIKTKQAQAATFVELDEVHQRVIEVVTSSLGSAHPMLIDCYASMAEIAERCNHFEAAAKYLKSAADVVRQCYGRVCIQYADTRLTQGQYLTQHTADEAVSVVEDALSIYERLVQVAYDDTEARQSVKLRCATCLFLIASAQAAPSSVCAAEIAFNTAARAFELRNEVLAGDHRDVLDSMLQLGELCVRLGDSYRALEYTRPALVVLKRLALTDEWALNQLDAVSRAVVRLCMVSLPAEKQAVVDKTTKRFAELVAPLSAAFSVLNSVDLSQASDEETQLLRFVMRKVLERDPVDYINQLIDKSDWEIQAARRQSFALNSVRRDSAAEAPVSPICSPTSPAASRFASFAFGQPPQLSMRPASPAPQSPIASPMRFSSVSTVMEPGAALFAPSGEFTSGAQLVALSLLAQ